MALKCFGCTAISKIAGGSSILSRAANGELPKWLRGPVANRLVVRNGQSESEYNAAVLMGWKILRYAENNMNDAVNDLKEALK